MLTTCSVLRSESARLRPQRGRPAVSMLELQVAMVVFGIALMGLCPLVLMQSKQLRQMQTWIQPQTTYYLVPAANTWTRKLGAVATMQTTAPSSTSPTSTGTANVVSILSMDRSLTSQQVTVQASVKTTSP